MKKAYFSGSFDLFHYGHLRAIHKARQIADKNKAILIIGVNTDALYRKYKKRSAIIPYKYRKEIVESLKGVDMVIPNRDFSPLKILKDLVIDIYIICREWVDTKKKEISYMKERGKKIEIIPYLKSISTTELRTKMVKNYLLHNVKLCPKCHKKN